MVRQSGAVSPADTHDGVGRFESAAYLTSLEQHLTDSAVLDMAGTILGRTYAVEYGDSWTTTSNSSRKAMGNCVSPTKIDADAPFRVQV